MFSIGLPSSFSIYSSKLNSSSKNSLRIARVGSKLFFIVYSVFDFSYVAKYPQGITEETVETGNSIVIRRTKVTDKHADVYERVFYAWGGTYFYKNGKNITQSLWDKESID